MYLNLQEALTAAFNRAVVEDLLQLLTAVVGPTQPRLLPLGCPLVGVDLP
jgi:hypothetical protein